MRRLADVILSVSLNAASLFWEVIMKRSKSACCIWLLLFVVVVSVGCNRERRCLISGVVLSEGKPVETGIIIFVPEDPDPTKSVVGATADIVDGHYAVSKSMALLPGRYKVCVYSDQIRSKETGELVDPYDVKDGFVNPLSVVHEDLVPPKFGRESEQYLDVGEDKEMVYDIKMFFD